MPENHPRTPEPRHGGAAGEPGPETPDAARTPDAAAEPEASPSPEATAAPGAVSGDAQSVSGNARSAPATRSAAKAAKKSSGKAAGNPVFAWLREVATVVVIAVVLSFLIKTFLFRAFFIPSESMVNTLDIDDRIFVNLLVPEPFALSRGDVVVFRDTKGWLPPATPEAKGPFTWVQDSLTFVGLLPDNTDQHLVKRVIGLPGDHVVCCDAGGKLTINGTAIDETYINPAEVPQVRPFDVTVPDGKVWVMGDNRNHSADSRSHTDTDGGFIDMKDLEGKAAVIAWPLNRITALGNYPEVFRDVPAAR